MTFSNSTSAGPFPAAALPTTTPAATKSNGSASAGTSSHQQTYTPQNILVTGGAGFIGSHVCLLLAQKYTQYKSVSR